MTKTIAVHARYNFLCISLPSSAKQQREMTKFCVVYGAWTTTDNFSHFHLELYAVVLNRSKHSRISLVKYNFILFSGRRPRRRGRRCISSLLSLSGRWNIAFLIGDLNLRWMKTLEVRLFLFTYGMFSFFLWISVPYQVPVLPLHVNVIYYSF